MSVTMKIDEAAKAMKAQILSRVAEEFKGVGTDTRQDLTGQIFFALKGDNFDAHLFLSQAQQKKAAVLVVHEMRPEWEAVKNLVTVLLVPDTLLALQDLARFWRRQMKARILALTGTNGKTTSKEFATALLGAHFRVHSNKGSFNNHWGVPLSLLSIAPEHEVAIIEMGMNHAGELQTLVQIAEPDVVAVTMVGRGHLEGMKSIENVAAAKNEIYQYSKPTAERIFNLDNPYTHEMLERDQKQRPTGKRWTFGTGGDVTLQVEASSEQSLTIAGTIAGVAGRAVVPVFGSHNVTNLMVAASFALACQMPVDKIWAALPRCQSGWGRNQWLQLRSGARALFDAYNANPESMKAALQGFQTLRAPRKFAILGEMLELGETAPALHEELGQLTAHAGFDGVLFIGPHAKDFERGLKASGFSKKSVITDSYKQNLASLVAPVLEQGDLILIKGSRGMQLERVLEEIFPLDFQKK